MNTPFTSRFHNIKHQQVRDLAVSSFSEPLISDFTSIGGAASPTHCNLCLTDKRLQWLQELDRNPQPLVDFLDQVKSRRLGFYHEALWHFFLQQDDEVELIASNCQVQQAGRTIGEFDVIYRDLHEDRVVHLELAFKIYLLAPGQPADDLSQWLGPNLNDRLDLKLDHMLNHQCRLSLLEAGKETLHALDIEAITQEISLRGCLFYGETIEQNKIKDSVLNPRHLTGKWSPLSEARQLLDQYEGWISLSNLQWICPITETLQKPQAATEFASYLQQHFEARQSPLMISAADQPESGTFTERFRLMVTPDNWPQRAAITKNG